MAGRDIGRRKTPPETEDDHAYMWDSAEKAQKAWLIVSPIYAAVSNWKGWAAIVGIFAAFRGNKVIEAVIQFLEGLK